MYPMEEKYQQMDGEENVGKVRINLKLWRFTNLGWCLPIENNDLPKNVVILSQFLRDAKT